MDECAHFGEVGGFMATLPCTPCKWADDVTRLTQTI